MGAGGGRLCQRFEASSALRGRACIVWARNAMVATMVVNIGNKVG